MADPYRNTLAEGALQSGDKVRHAFKPLKTGKLIRRPCWANPIPSKKLIYPVKDNLMRDGIVFFLFVDARPISEMRI